MNRKHSLKQDIFRTLIALSIPTILEQILSTLLQYVDTAMVGRLGEQATAAVSITTTITWLVGSMASAIGVAVLALISRYVGSGDEQSVKGISKQTLLMVVVSGVLFGVVSVVLSPYIPVWMGVEDGIRKQASLYFAIISLPMVFRTSTTILGAAIRATKDTKTPMMISVVSNVMNILLNAIFIYLLHWGVIGAAIGTAISHVVAGSAMFAAYRKRKILHWKWRTFEINIKHLTDCAKIGLPVFATNIVSCLGYVVFAGLVSGMGTTIFAAHSIAVTAETIFYIPGYGLRTATSTMIGIALGENDRKKFEAVVYISVLVTMGMMILDGVLLYLISYPLMGLLTSSTKVAVLGSKMLKLVAFSEPFFGLMVIMEGIFYGLGRTGYVFVIETISMWIVRIVFTVLCVKVWHLDLYAVWCCMISDNVFKAVMLSLPVLSKRGREKIYVTNGGTYE